MSMPPSADTFMPAAIAEPRIRILKIKLAVLRGRSKHERHDPCFSGVELRILLKNGKNKFIRLQSQYTSRSSHRKSERNCRIATVRSDINGEIPWFQKSPKFIDGLLTNLFSRFFRMQPLCIFDLAVSRQIENTYFEPIQSGLRPKAQQIPEFPCLHCRFSPPDSQRQQ